jgi:hypothetical protein
MSMTEQTIKEHPDIFRADEAGKYLKLPNRRSLNRLCRRFGVKGQKSGRQWIYSREQLDALRLKWFGMDLPKGRKR